MFSRSALSAALAALALLPAAFGSPIPRAIAPRDDSITYHMYSGTGSTNDFWPEANEWLGTFDQMFALNTRMLSSSCAQFGVPDNSESEVEAIRESITSVAEETGVDPRFILAVMVQESKGCVRAPTTDNGVRNPGLFQCHNGSASCNDNGSVQTPCPASTIRQMVSEGVSGTDHGDGLFQLVTKAGGIGNPSAYYRAARMYNSGSIAGSGNLGEGIATKCYSSDVANRLIGWVDGPSNCCLDEGCSVPAPSPNVISQQKAASSSGNQTIPGGSKSIKTPKKPTEVEAETVSEPETKNKPSSNTKACSRKESPQAGETCTTFAAKYSLSAADFMKMNPSINDSCSNMIAGQTYCVA